MLTQKEIEEFTLTQEEIDEACEGAVEAALSEFCSSSKHVATNGDVYSVGKDKYGHPTMIPLMRVFPGV